MKFVRWLGAFGKSESISEAATWELAQTERQVAAEPLHKGVSHLAHALIGLEIAHPEATFARGWLKDSYTVPNNNGINRATRNRLGEFKNMDKFLKFLNKNPLWGHAEASFNCPIYSSVVVKRHCSERVILKAKKLAEELNLPLRTL